MTKQTTIVVIGALRVKVITGMWIPLFPGAMVMFLILKSDFYFLSQKILISHLSFIWSYIKSIGVDTFLISP